MTPLTLYTDEYASIDNTRMLFPSYTGGKQQSGRLVQQKAASANACSRVCTRTGALLFSPDSILGRFVPIFDHSWLSSLVLSSSLHSIQYSQGMDSFKIVLSVEMLKLSFHLLFLSWQT